MSTPDWWGRALCQDLDPEIFFPEKHGPKDTQVEEAKAFCRVCMVRQDCLDYALAADDRWGIFGGTTDEERKRIKKIREEAAA